MAARARILPYVSLIWSLFFNARLWVPSCVHIIMQEEENKTNKKKNEKNNCFISKAAPLKEKWELTLRLEYLYIRFSELVPPVFNISINRFSYGAKPQTSLTKSRTIFVRLEMVPFLFDGRTAFSRFSTG